MNKRLLVVPLALFLGGVARGEPDERVAEPTPAQQADAEKLVKEVYKEEYTKRGPDDRRALALKLLSEGQGTKSDANTQYVLLREAREMAGQVADVDTALEAADEISKTFKVDPAESRFKALNFLKGSVRSPEACVACADTALLLIDTAMKAENFEMAGKIADLAALFAAGGKNMQQVTDVQARKGDIKAGSAAYLDMKIAQDKLKTSPTDAAARYTVGTYLCLYKGDWDKGLPNLADAPDPEWKAAAKADLALPLDVGGMLKVADAWWDLAGKATAGKPRILARAEFWYNQCMTAGADGLTKAKVEKRLDAIETTKTSSPLVNVSEATRKLLPTVVEINKIKEIAGNVRTNSSRIEEMNTLIADIQRRLADDLLNQKETDYVARMRGDAQVRKIADTLAPGYNTNRSMLQSSLGVYFSQAKTKEELVTRMMALEKFVTAEKALDKTQFDNCVYSGTMNYMSGHYQQFPSVKDRADFCTFLKNKGIKSEGLDRVRAYYTPRVRTIP